MDPNAALAQLRMLGHAIMNAGEGDDTSFNAVEMAETLQGLDVWLSRGGFLPDAWRRGKVP